MGRKKLTFYCVVCLDVLCSWRYSSLARFAYYSFLFVRRPDLHHPQRICGVCEAQLVHPYEIVLQCGFFFCEPQNLHSLSPPSLPVQSPLSSFFFLFF